jgi:preprotein translocase subunit SecD
MNHRKNLLFLFLIFVLAYFAFAFVYPGPWTPSWLPVRDFRYGLDLQGGASLIYQADLSSVPTEDWSDALEGARDVIERRIDFFGIAEPRVAVREASYQLSVELPGVSNLEEALEMIGETPVLEFKEMVTIGSDLSEEAAEQKNLESLQLAESVLARALEGEDFSGLAMEYSDCPSGEAGGDLGYFSFEQMVESFSEAAFDLETEEITSSLVETQFGYHIIKKTAEENEDGEIRASHILFAISQAEDTQVVWQNTELTGRHLLTARRSLDTMTGQALVELEFNQEGAKLFEEITARNIGQPLAIFLDGGAIIDTTGDGVIDHNDLYAPVIQEKISGGKAVISGNMSPQEATQISQRLKSGALPVPIELISQRAVGPTLGRESLEKSLVAAAWGILAVIIFMIIFYRLPGLVASIALVFFVVFLLSLFKLIPQITLTMAGIGGAILSIGMAVDANILIFERMKEELKEAKDFARSVENGFQRAWPSIRDGSITTLVIAVIMWFFGTSFIRGFALTLGFGVALSLFSAIFVTRLMLRVIYGNNRKKLKWLWPS